jgi:hypothetical protein
VNAKYVDKVPITSLDTKLVELGVSARAVNGAWGVVRDALREARLHGGEQQQ